MKRIQAFSGIFLLIGTFSFIQPVLAKEIDLPSITEVPKLKKETMLKDLDIPAVRDRNPDPTAGPRLSVKEFRLQGIIEYPELGITKAEVSKIVESIRFDMMDEGEFLESGYTLKELSEMSDLLVDIEKNVKERHVGPLEVQKLVWLVREQMAKRGVTLGMIETVADRITRYYREHGFILAKAYIPKQEVRDGVVTLSLLLGVLGDTKVNNNELYDQESLQAVFDDVKTKPVTSDAIEERLFLLNDYPGLTTQGFFEAGGQVGDTLLNVNVVSENSYHSNVRFDNHGTEETGEYRAYGEFFWNNPTSTADQLHLGVLKGNTVGSDVEGSDTVYGQVKYSTNIFSPRVNVGVGYATNSFVVGQNESGQGNNTATINFDIFGETVISDFGVSYKIKRSRIENYTARLTLENIDSNVNVAGQANFIDEEVQNMTIGFDLELLQESDKMLHQASVKYKQGDLVSEATSGQNESYSIIQADYSLLSFWKIPFTDVETRSILRSSFQYTDDKLSSINRFSLGGPSRTRGFSAKIFSADTAIHVGADLFFSAPDFLDYEFDGKNLKNMVAPFVFVDLARGESFGLAPDGNNGLKRVTTEANLLSFGVGLQFSFSQDFNAKLQVASAVSNDFNKDTDSGSNTSEFASEEGETKVLFELQYRL